jgi:hypothetical protein
MLAFAGSVAQNAVLAQIPRITDTYIQNVSDGYQSQNSLKVFGAYVRSDAASAIRLESPSLRVPSFPRFAQYDGAANPPNLPPFNDYGDSGPVIPALDPFNVTVSRAGAGAFVSHSLLFMGNSRPSPIVGECRTILCTSAVTTSATAWTPATMTLSDSLPYGRYRIVGAMGFGTGLLAGRFVFPDRQNRPGFLAQQAVDEYGWDYFRYGKLGAWGEFNSTAFPVMEFLNYAANSAQTVQIDIMRVS